MGVIVTEPRYDWRRAPRSGNVDQLQAPSETPRHLSYLWVIASNTDQQLTESRRNREVKTEEEEVEVTKDVCHCLKEVSAYNSRLL